MYSVALCCSPSRSASLRRRFESRRRGPEPAPPSARRKLGCRERLLLWAQQAHLDGFLLGHLAAHRALKGLTWRECSPYSGRTAGQAWLHQTQEFVRLILEKRLPWVGRLQGVRGYHSVLVNIDDVKPAMRKPSHGGLSLRKVAQKLNTADRALVALIAGKHLATFTARNALNCNMQTLVSQRNWPDSRRRTYRCTSWQKSESDTLLL
jgi:hypothetical protein